MNKVECKESAPYRVLIADDQYLFSENLKLMLETLTDDFKVVGIAANGEEAVSLAQKTQPDLVLMDVRMPVMDGVQAVKILHPKIPQAKIVMLTTFSDDVYLESALQYGAQGYILKTIKSQDFITSLRAITQGAVLFSNDVLEQLVIRMNSDFSSGEDLMRFKEIVNSLGTREKEILKLLSKGYSNKKIADALFLTEPTIRNYISSIYAKIGSNDRLKVISIARRTHIEQE
jgi:DNA-binding NarL/FixJ family response regulator